LALRDFLWLKGKPEHEKKFWIHWYYRSISSFHFYIAGLRMREFGMWFAEKQQKEIIDIITGKQ